MKKISLLKGLTLFGAVVLASTCVAETVLLLKDKKNSETDTKFDISTLNNYIIDYQFNSKTLPHPDDLLPLLQNAGVQPIGGGTNVTLQDINDLIIPEDDIGSNSFILATRDNSVTYEANKHATIYFSTGTLTELSSIIATTPDLFLDKYVDETTTKANILTNLKNQYPSLNINDLVVGGIQ
ncbi:MAG: hypothetical protein LBV48_02385, partial [Mycoplasmataceae bacterium]|nr:hypothetical protein [Mycoplasmataceae bacterium]